MTTTEMTQNTSGEKKKGMCSWLCFCRKSSHVLLVLIIVFTTETCRKLGKIGKIINPLKMNMPLCAVTFIVLFCLFSVHTTNINMLLAQRTLEYFEDKNISVKQLMFVCDSDSMLIQCSSAAGVIVLKAVIFVGATRGSALQKRLRDREKEIEADERDRKREKEELEEIRQRLLDEGHPDPDAELRRVRTCDVMDHLDACVFYL